MNKIRVVIDVVAQGARKSVQDFRKEVAAADGVTGKFKAGWSGVGSLVKANAALIGTAAVAAGAALVAFGKKGVDAFNELAIEAGKMAEATGLAVEDMSRWIEVAGDIGIESSTLEKSFGILNRQIGSGNKVLDQYGIAAVRAADGTVDMNATVLAAIDTVRKIDDPTKRAAAAQAAFGRGWMEMAELIGMSTSDIKANLDSVSDAKVIDEEEVRKAREYRAAMDNLNDAVEDVFLMVGEALTPAITEFAGVLSDNKDELKEVAANAGEAVTQLARLGGGLADIKKKIQDIPVLGWWAENLSPAAWAVNGLGRALDVLGETASRAGGLWDQTLGNAFDKFSSSSGDAVMSAKEIEESLGDLDQAARGRAAPGLKKLADEQENAAKEARIHEEALRLQARALENTERRHRDAADAAREQAGSIDDLIGEQARLIGGQFAVRDAERRAKDATDEYNKAAKEGNLTEEELEELRDRAAEATLRAAQAAGDYEADVREANGETLTAAERTGLWGDALDTLAGQLDPSGALRSNLRGLKSEIDAVADRQSEIDAANAAAAQSQMSAWEAQRDRGAQQFGGFARRGDAPTASNTTINNVTNINPPSGPQSTRQNMRDWERRNGSGR